MSSESRRLIRKAASPDAAALAVLSGELGYPTETPEMEQRLRRVMADPRNAVFVADEPSPVGWIQVSIVESLEGGGFAEILGLVVASAHRRTGVGADLVRKAESWARENGCSRIRVRTNIVRSDAHAFYARLGYGLKKRQEVFDKKLE